MVAISPFSFKGALRSCHRCQLIPTTFAASTSGATQCPCLLFQRHFNACSVSPSNFPHLSVLRSPPRTWCRLYRHLQGRWNQSKVSHSCQRAPPNWNHPKLHHPSLNPCSCSHIQIQNRQTHFQRLHAHSQNVRYRLPHMLRLVIYLSPTP